MSPVDAVSISFYYILNGVIFQAPTLKKIIDAKAQNAIFLLSKAFDEVSRIYLNLTLDL